MNGNDHLLHDASLYWVVRRRMAVLACVLPKTSVTVTVLQFYPPKNDTKICGLLITRR